MKYQYIKTAFLLFVLLAATGLCQVRLPKLISDGMVLQRDAKVKIWGWAAKNEKVTVRFLHASYQTKADANGDWQITLPNLKAGGPYEMEVKGPNIITIRNILVGDVWVCSGQSNMELQMNRVSPIYEDEIANATNDKIRHFAVPQTYNFNTPQKDLAYGVWKSADPKNVLEFSAVAYFFAKELYAKYKIPIGLINTSLGGSPAEAWISERALKEFPAYLKEAQRFKDSSLIKQIETQDNKRIQAWYELLRAKDEGYKNPQKTWSDAALPTEGWEKMNVPGYWAATSIGPVNGVVWFRKTINVGPQYIGKPVKLILGRIVDADSVFVNGKFIGTTSYQYPPRRYAVPENVLKEGENTIVVRVISNSGKGGFVADKLYAIVTGKDTLDLRGEWSFRLGAKMDPLGGQTFVRWKPLGLYNAMIAPLLNYRMKGVLWYQGESNAERPIEYRKLLPALIADWRQNWKQGKFPFLIVQLPNYMEKPSLPGKSNWAMLREAQLKTVSVKNTGLAVAIDLGEWNDIHPLDKKDVAKRLALAAQKIAYHDKNIVSSGPIYKSMKINRNKIVLSFTDFGSGLVAKGNGKLQQFAIAGADKKFVWANAEIVNNTVIVHSDEVVNPIAVRYAWADNPEGANLYNKEGLPASPFRTDHFGE
jgi:sialate O-acetylesterase